MARTVSIKSLGEKVAGGWIGQAERRLMATGTRTFATLELSQSAYDEIERKLLDAGYEHLFMAGPGSAIDMHGIAVERSDDIIEYRTGMPIHRAEPEAVSIVFKDTEAEAAALNAAMSQPRSSRFVKAVFEGGIPAGYKLTENKPRPRFCFECGENVVGPCERKDCLEAVSQRTAGDEAAA